MVHAEAVLAQLPSSREGRCVGDEARAQPGRGKAQIPYARGHKGLGPGGHAVIEGFRIFPAFAFDHEIAQVVPEERASFDLFGLVFRDDPGAAAPGGGLCCREDQRASEAAVKYFFLGALSAAILAYGLSFMYGVAGTTVMHTVSEGVAVSTLPYGANLSGMALIGFLLVFGGLAFKIAAVPFHVYVPDVYEGAASPITGMLGSCPSWLGLSR